ncbi:MAG: ATP-binding protein [Bacillus sp. (in: Bacteria)]|nr:ATP-binding protein [Bacillus sp. (in: firmicutes)]
MNGTKDFLQDSIKTILSYIEKNESYFIKEWEENIIFEEEENPEKIKENGNLMYAFIKKSLYEEYEEEAAKRLAYKVAEERIKAKTNMGNFMYNINLGRSIIIKHIIKTGIPSNALEIIIEKINQQLNDFCYHAVTRYTELKDKEIHEKNMFIQQSHKDRLAILGQISSSFVHEFRNPLTSVIGFTKLLRRELHDHKYLDIIDHELNQLSYRITQFLHTSKISNSNNELEEVNITKLVMDILTFMYPSIADEDVTVTTNLQPNVTILGHEEELKQVFLNILFNSIDAVKGMNKTRKIHVSCADEGEGVRVTISNNGPAIPTHVQETIFEPFYTTKDMGTGIGLFVCKKIIEKHQGEIICQSDDKETKFIISL